MYGRQGQEVVYGLCNRLSYFSREKNRPGQFSVRTTDTADRQYHASCSHSDRQLVARFQVGRVRPETQRSPKFRVFIAHDEP